MNITRTYTYAILEVSQSTIDDIKDRLLAIDYLDKFLSHDSDGKEIIILGTTALKAETDER